MILVIGYGSLMSRFGIDERNSTEDLEVFNPFIVRFEGDRGFNTDPGHYLDIGKDFDPIGDIININETIDKSRNTFECLAYYIKVEALQKVAQREGYPEELMKRIKKELSHYNKDNDQPKNIAEFLWTFYPSREVNLNYGEKIQKYRKKLGKCIKLDIINANRYIPHPVKVKCRQNNKSIFGLISIHTDIGAKKYSHKDIRLMTINEAIRSGNLRRDTYFLECILGGVHGINVRDLLSRMDIDDEKIGRYINNLEERIKKEWKKTQDWEFHGCDLRENLERSGIFKYFPKLSLEFGEI